MNSKIYERLFALYKQLGAEPNDKSADKAELLGLCAGLELAENAMNKNLLDVFLDTAGERGLAMFLSEAGEAARETQAESKRAVTQAFSQGGHFLTCIELEEAVKALNEAARYSVQNGAFVLESGLFWGREFLQKISDFAKDFAPAIYSLELGFDGVPFELWDDEELCWYELDALELPFSALDTI